MTLIKKAKDEFFFQRKFGIISHWGLYALLGGVWKGQRIPYISEWIMKRCRIPVVEYEKLAEQFKPTDFDAEKWIDIVERSGSRYFVFTAKHHDGFSMYRSKADRYNIVDASHCSVDPVEVLSEACRNRGIKFCLYYSQDQDWHHPHGTGNAWDFDEQKKNFSIYFEEKVKPQITELLTNYGPIGLIWFDTPQKISKQHSQELFDLVHQLQPECLVNGRLGHGIGDYGQTEDNDIPSVPMEQPWEVPATINDTWGYKIHDRNWKSPHVLIEHLLEVISKGGNYLLNLGPDARGNIPVESIERVEALGRWLKINGDAVFKTRPTPFVTTFPWGHVTSREKTLFLHITDPNTRRIELTGLCNKITGAYLLDRKGIPLKYTQSITQDHFMDTLSIRIPETCFYTSPFVVVLQSNEDISVNNIISQQPDGNVILEAYRGNFQSTLNDCGIKLGSLSSMQGWFSPQAKMKWTFRIHSPGIFKVSVLTAARREDGDPASPINWDSGHHIRISSAGHQISGIIEQNFFKTDEGSYAKFIGSTLGAIEFDSPGDYHLTLEPESINSEHNSGFTLRSVIISPMALHNVEDKSLQMSH